MNEQASQAVFQTRRFTTILVGGTAAIVCACIGAILWVLAVSTSSIDATEAGGDSKLLHSVVETYRENLARNVADYASWDEVYNNFTKVRDRRWEAQNLGPSITQAFDVDLVAVTTVTGVIVYFYAKHGRTLPSAADAHTLASLTRSTAGSRKPLSGVARIGDHASLVAIAPIRPTSPARARELSGYNLIEVRSFKAGMLSTIGKDFGFDALHVAHAASPAIVLSAPSGGPSGFVLTWKPAKAGRHLFDRVLPAVVLTGLLLVLGVVAVIMVWSRIVQRIRKSEKLVLKAEITATRARAASAEEMARSKSAFMANMSHELRTPLNAIIGFSEIIDTETLGPIGSPKYKEYIKDIHASGNHLLRIINDILLVSKVEAGKFSPHIEDVEFSGILHDSLRMLEIIAAKRGIRLQSSGPAQMAIRVDAQALRQILINVISNAVKFSPVGGRVDIRCAVADGMLVVEVEDHGCGMPSHVLREIGKPFVQAESAYTRNFQGTGLGLAICFRLVGTMGASISVDSKVDVGTTVTVRLPLSASRQAVA